MNINTLPKNNNHLTIQDRKNISHLYNHEKIRKFAEIARRLGYHRSTISREFERNGTINITHWRSKYTPKYSYNGETAQARSEKRKHTPKINVHRAQAIRLFFVENWIDNIQQTYNNFKMLYPNEYCPCLQTIYNWHHNNTMPLEIKYTTKIKVTKPRCKKASKVDPTKVNIRIRDEKIDVKKVFGHGEIDTVYSNQGSKACVLTFNEISSGKYFAIKIPDRTSNTVYNAILELIAKIGKENIKSITSDNGTEFSKGNLIAYYHNIPGFFCDPYSSGQRGQNERLNRDLRKFFPKGTNFEKITQNDIEIAVKIINSNARLKHNFKSSDMVYDEMKRCKNIEIYGEPKKGYNFTYSNLICCD